MNSFCYSKQALASQLKLHLLSNYPAGATLPMSDLPLPEKKRLDLSPPVAPVTFDNKQLKDKMSALFPNFGFEGLLLIARREEVKESDTLLAAIRSKITACDLFVIEESSSLPSGNYKAVVGTESAFKLAEAKFAPINFSKVRYFEWTKLSQDKEAKKELWNRLLQFK